MSSEIIILIILVLVSAFFSGTEIAFVVSNKIKIEIKARKKNIAALSAHYFMKNPQTFFSTILIGNNTINIAFASISTVFLAYVFSLNELDILLISSSVLLLFGELIPKYLARELPDRITLLTAIPLRIITLVLYPFVKVTSSISGLFTQSSSMKAENVKFLFSKEDLEILVQESHKAGMVNKKESDIISKVLTLGDQRVYEAMRPRTEIVGVEINSTIDDAFSLFN